MKKAIEEVRYAVGRAGSQAIKQGRKRVKPAKDGDCYRQFHRVIDGAIRDAFTMHPDYLTAKGTRQNTARRSISKRVVGAVLGWVEQSTQGRSGQEPAPGPHGGASFSAAHDVDADTSALPLLPRAAAGGPLGQTEARL